MPLPCESGPKKQVKGGGGPGKHRRLHEGTFLPAGRKTRVAMNKPCSTT
uniref:Uncharacterized protein n=1 Tax=Anguilla anguilla TaxID=7936 RepID=A0A0E9UD18_ANGAN